MVPFLDLILNRIMNYYHSNCVDYTWALCTKHFARHCCETVSACFVCLTSIIEVGYINLTFRCIIVINCSCSALHQLKLWFFILFFFYFKLSGCIVYTIFIMILNSLFLMMKLSSLIASFFLFCWFIDYLNAVSKLYDVLVTV